VEIAPDVERLATFVPMKIVASGIAGVVLVIAAFRYSFLNWIVDLPGSLVSRFTSVDLHEGEGALGFLLGIFLAWLWMAVAAWLLIYAVQRIAMKSRRARTGAPN